MHLIVCFIVHFLRAVGHLKHVITTEYTWIAHHLGIVGETGMYAEYLQN
jgi:hypothetical protein